MESESLMYSGLEIPRDYFNIKGEVLHNAIHLLNEPMVLPTDILPVSAPYCSLLH